MKIFNHIKKFINFAALIVFLLNLPCGKASGEDIGGNFSQNGNLLNLNSIVIDKAAKEIRLKVRLAISDGIMEYFLVEERGKAYESVFKIIGNKPSELNFALILLGFVPLEYDVFMKLLNQKDALIKLKKDYSRSLLDISAAKGNKNIPLGEIISDREGKDGELLWVYTGGFLINNNRYAGDASLSYIGIWPDDTTSINLFSSNKNHYRGNFGFEMKKGLKVGDEYELIIRGKRL